MSARARRSRSSRALGVPAFLLLVVASAAAAPSEESARRAAVGPALERGWQRLALPPEAALASASLWLADESGAPRPFLAESAWHAHSASRVAVEIAEQIAGVDAEGRPTIEFRPLRPAGAAEAEGADGPALELGLELVVAAVPPWAARLEIERRSGAGDWIALVDRPRWLSDLGSGHRAGSTTLPWDGERYRVRLVTLEGRELALERVEAWIERGEEGGRFDAELELRLDDASHSGSAPEADATGGRTLRRLRLPRLDRVVAVELDLVPPVAPIGVELRIPAASGASTEAIVVARGSLWNLPAVGAAATRVELDRPRVVEALELALPRGVVVRSARALVRRERLLLVAEPGETFWLRWGATPRRAPGALDVLAGGTEAALAARRTELPVAAAEPDPDATHAAPALGERLRPLLVPAVALVSLLLAIATWRQLRAAGGEMS